MTSLQPPAPPHTPAWRHLVRWPLPAVVAWGLCAALERRVAHLLEPGLHTGALAAAAAVLLGLGLALLGRRSGYSRTRALVLAGGYPLLLLATAAPAAQVPAWAWLGAAALLLAIYPVRAWRDAPLFPTPGGALQGLAMLAPLPDHARVLDAGCGLGDGLRALRAAYPRARLEGVEWSWALRLASALRCPWAQVRQGDMWAGSWQDLGLVYLFQRPESMPRAWAKAQAELPAGAWLVSLEFPVVDQPPTASLHRQGQRPVWLYRIGARTGLHTVPSADQRPRRLKSARS